MKRSAALAMILVLSLRLSAVAEEEGTTMAIRKGMPPIDAAAPAKTETATFALG
ncbi:MAG: hypothetical protein M1438_08150 [Deltaproteobacteria bacterium]|nr:hypothetical protein [Deltaproteobacteria bacterium]